MQRTKITVSYGRTQSLQSYSNVKPQVIVEATLDEGDDPAAVRAQLLAEAREFVHEVIDQALEDDEQPAKFSQAPRYGVYYTSEVHFGDWRDRRKAVPPEPLIVLVPREVRLDRPEGDAKTWWNRYGSNRLRYAHAVRVAHSYQESNEGFRFIICTDGDLSRLPEWAQLPPVDPGPPPAEPITAKRTDADGLDEHYGEDELDDYDPEDDDDGEPTAAEAFEAAVPDGYAAERAAASADGPAREVHQ